MLIFDDNSKAIIIESIYTPTLSDAFWVLDLEMMDFTVTPLLTLEEIVSPSITLQIAGFSFQLPATWNMLVVDEETSQLDLIESSRLAGKNFSSFSYGPNQWNFSAFPITVTDFSPRHVHTGPSLNKHQMLCHPIGPESWINIAPSDTFNRYLKNRVAGDLM